ncbi:VIT1/CCC1 transporter family protein [Candidatus Nomurabacteria bacterium]|nr:VIT1/CCC1 transporter family protein [Candidatus Nomurabacteria bacterium]
METIPHRKDFIHHQNSKLSDNIRELVFGMEDGMVSTLGAVTGIAAGTGDAKIVILSGLVVVTVESISMAIGSYISNQSVKQVEARKLYEEGTEVKDYPEAEKEELIEMYIEDGWPKNLAQKMAEVASKNHDLMLKEMAYRELNIDPAKEHRLGQGAIVMFFSYIIGGAFPISMYLFLEIPQATYAAIILTLIGLFLLGAFATKFTKINWLKSSLQMVALGGLATLIGYLVGRVADLLF